MYPKYFSVTISCMSIIQSIILGAIQGITEFLPISSSGHLLLAQEFFSIPRAFAFDVLLNIGTLTALVIFFRKRLINTIQAAYYERNYRYLGYVILASLPTLVIGFFGDSFFEKLGTYTWVIVLMLTGLGAVMVLCGKAKGTKTLQKKDTFIIGAAQILALIPGTSRSGVTILAGTLRGVNIKAATEFSFMLAIPTITAAIAHTLFFKDGINYIQDNATSVLIGNITSFTLGFIAVKTLVKLLHDKGLAPFGWYRIALGAIIPVVLLFKLM